MQNVQNVQKEGRASRYHTPPWTMDHGTHTWVVDDPTRCHTRSFVLWPGPLVIKRHKARGGSWLSRCMQTAQRRMSHTRSYRVLSVSIFYALKSGTFRKYYASYGRRNLNYSLHNIVALSLTHLCSAVPYSCVFYFNVVDFYVSCLNQLLSGKCFHSRLRQSNIRQTGRIATNPDIAASNNKKKKIQSGPEQTENRASVAQVWFARGPVMNVIKRNQAAKGKVGHNVRRKERCCVCVWEDGKTVREGSGELCQADED